MNNLKYASLMAMIFTLSGCVFHVGAKSADVHIEKSMALSSDQLKMLEVDAGAGLLTIKGVDGATDIDVQANIYTNKNHDYLLTLEKVGSRAVLVAKHKSTSGFWNGDSPRIDLVVKVPKNLILDIDDGSGSISVTNINNLVEIDDGSGEIHVNNINGDLIIEDGSGEIEVSNVSGNIDIEDGSGELFVKEVGGSVNIDDGSGDLTLRHIGGKVTIDDGSGGIEVTDAGGLTITESGSGGLKVKDIKGEFNIDS